MTASGYVDVAPDVEDRVRAICMALPGAHEEWAWTGSPRWLVRKKTFAHLLAIEPGSGNAYDRLVTRADAWPAGGGEVTLVTFRAMGEELMALRHTGVPFLDAGFGRDAISMVVADPDWDEITELLTESYRLLAPAKLAAQLEERCG